MALKAQSAFNFGFEVTTSNQNLPFQYASGAGHLANAVIAPGWYTLGQLALAIAAAMNAADNTNTYTCTVARTVTGQTPHNRITIATNGAFLSLLFSSGTTAATSVRDLIAFAHTDFTGATNYTNVADAGTYLVPSWVGKNYLPPSITLKNIGTVNIATDGTKEAVTWAINAFIGVKFDYEPQAAALAFWPAFIKWAIQQRPFEFTPEVTTPTTFYPVTLESTKDDAAGLAWSLMEMVQNDLPFHFTTQDFKMRVIGAQ
jgi:hypothetical protein